MTEHSQPRPHTEDYFFDTTNTLENPNTQNPFSPHPPVESAHHLGSPRPKPKEPTILKQPTRQPDHNEGTAPVVER